ncbi:MAG TPA: hypothetical protein VIL37_10655 [Natronosporangium sp.]
MGQPLVDEAMKKAAIAWLAVDGAPARMVWCLPAEGALWVVTGPGEQDVPGLAAAAEVRVTLRGDHGGRIVTWPAAVTRLDPGSEQWQQIAPQLANKRLNASLSPPELVDRWAAECAIYRLAPAGDPTEAGPTLPADSLAEPPRDTPARRAVRTPFRLHRVRRR